MEDIQLVAFGEVLRTYRKTKKLTQRQLANRMGVHYNTVWAWERGDYLPETKGIVLELARQLELADSETRQLLESSLTSLSSHWNVPYQRNPYFTGRESVLQQMDDLLLPAQEVHYPCTLALSGLGGIGKTQTAIEFAYRHAQDYAAIFWLHAETAEHLRADLIALADLLNLPERQEQNQDQIVSAVQRWLTIHRHWLLVVDNVQEIEPLTQLLPATRRGSLLFTTRLPTLGTLAQTLRLEQMDREEGVQFLLLRSRRSFSHTSPGALADATARQERRSAEQLFAAMDGLPLALDQAGAYIEKAQSNLSDFLHMFQQYPLHLLHARESYDEHPVSVAKTFLLAFERLQQTNPTASTLLTVYCMLPLDSIPEELVTEGNAYLGPLLSRLGTDMLLYHQLVQDLLAYSFVRRLPETRSISVHRLVQLVIREQLETETQRQWAACLLQAANAILPQWKNEVFPNDDMDDWPRNQRLLPLVFACEQLIDQYHVSTPEALHLLIRAAYYLNVRAQYQQAEALCLKALRISAEINHSEPIDTGIALGVLVLIYDDLGRYEEAQEICQRALAIHERFLGPEHQASTRLARVLAELYRMYGKYQEAEELFLRTLTFYEQSQTTDELALARCLDSLGNLYRTQKQFARAEPLFRRAIALQERLLGLEHSHTATSLHDLARLCTDMGHYEEAEILFQRALAVFEHLFGPEHPFVATVLVAFGQLYFVQQRYSEAEALYLRSFALQERLYPPEHTYFVITFTKLGQLYLAQKRYADAEENLQHALSLAERTLAPEHEQIAVIRAELSRLETIQRDSNET